MLSRSASNWLIQKKTAVVRRLRKWKFRFLGVRLRGDVDLRRISIPRNFHDIEISSDTALDDGIVLIASGKAGPQPKIRIGSGCYLNRYTIIDASLSVEIGDSVMMGPYCYVTDHDHGTVDGTAVGEQPLEEAATVIGRGAWLGARVTVLKGVHVGDGAIVGAGAVVTKDIPANKIAVGIPARVVGERLPPH